MDTVTAVDVVHQQSQLEQLAAQVLPYSFDKCTRPLGFINQSIYACLTCCPNNLRGCCYSCSIACHGDHDLLELWTKRSFACDCGAGRMSQCSLTRGDPAWADENQVGNVYGHNFRGRYCTCNGTYVEGESMVQCMQCQDWFHDTCLNEKVDEDDELLCAACVDKYPFVARYGKSPTTYLVVDGKRVKGDEGGERKRVCVEESEECTWTRLAQRQGHVLFDPTWRDTICGCGTCEGMFKDVEFLKQEEEEYVPEMDTELDKSLMDRAMESLAQMDHVRVMDGIDKFSTFKHLILVG